MFWYLRVVRDKSLKIIESKFYIKWHPYVKLEIPVEGVVFYIYKVYRCYISAIILTELVDSPTLPKELLKMFQV